MGSNPDYIATVSFSKLTCEIIFQIYGEREHRGEISTNLRSNSKVRVKLRVGTVPEWELWPKQSHSKNSPILSSGT